MNALFIAVVAVLFAQPVFASGDRHDNDWRDHGRPSSGRTEVTQRTEVETRVNQDVEQRQNLKNSIGIEVDTSSGVPQAPAVPPVPGVNPELFPGIKAAPVNGADRNDYLRLLGQCAPEFEGISSNTIFEKGASGKTEVTLNPFRHSGWNTKHEKTVLAVTSGVYSVVCLGTVQVTAAPGNAPRIDFPTVIQDAGLAVNRNILVDPSKIIPTSRNPQVPGSKVDKYLWLIPIELLYVVGVDSGNAGGAVSPGSSHVNGATFLGVGLTFGKNAGSAYPAGSIGGKFYVFAPVNDGVGVPVHFGNFSNMNEFYSHATAHIPKK